MRDILLDTSGISQALKIPRREIGHYVDKYGLPAFKDKPGTSWKARPAALMKWAKAFESMFINGHEKEP